MMINKGLNMALSAMGPEDVANLYKSVFGGPGADLVLQDLANRCFVDTPTFANVRGYEGVSQEAREGMRSVYLHIQTQINYEPPPIQEDMTDAG